MEFRVLGPLEVAENGRSVDLGGPTQRALLAILLLHANEVVSVDRLIDELWGDEPPATAVKTLQAHVSRLRRALNGTGEDRVETRGHGYLLHVREGELDADRFRDLLEEARDRLADGDADGAAGTLEEALAIWRGPALAGLARNSFARSEVARLDELRLAATEERVEADLARGRHAEVVADLEQLVERHPLRERLRGQLMLALYRSGRQAQALSVYQDGRRALADDLGLEPSQGLRQLEQRILEQDPALAPPAPPSPRRRAAAPALQRRDLRVPLLAGAAAVVAIAVLALVLLTGGGDEDDGPDQTRAGVRALDARSGALEAAVPLGSSPAQIAVGLSAVWTVDAEDRTISRIDPAEPQRARTFSTASTPTDLSIGAGALWVGNASRTGRFGAFPVSVSRLDPESGVVDATIRLPGGATHPYFPGGGLLQQKVAATDEAVWAINPDRSVSRIDPRTNRVVARIDGVTAESVAAGEEGVWVVEPSGDPDGAAPGITRIDPRTNRPARRVEIGAESLTTVTVGAGSVWVADPFGGSVWRVNPVPEPRLRQVALEVGVRGIAFGAGRLWVTNEFANTVHTIDPRTNRARLASRVAAPQSVAVGTDDVWVTALGDPEADTPLPANACSDVLFRGPGDPRLVVVSNLPLKVDFRPMTVALRDGIRHVFERRGFRAGEHTVGYASCDDSTVQAGGTDASRCFANARAYARRPDVVGVIGAFLSYCSEIQVPILNQAPGGPVAMISPSNTFIGLTRPYRGMPEGDLEELYPTGKRNYVRIAAADHLAPVALAQAAKELGRSRVYVTWDGEDSDAALYADTMRAAARALKLEVVGATGWDPTAGDFGRFARRVAAERPDAVLMTGAAPPGTPALLRDLRAALGRGPALIASDGFAAFDTLAESGRAARGMYVGNYGIPNAELPPAGRRLMQAAGRPDDDPDFMFAYGAQSAEILLDAIARSDGSRASVTRELRNTNVEDGILGDIRFDENGDLVEGPVTIYRFDGKKPVVDRVVTVRATGGA